MKCGKDTVQSASPCVTKVRNSPSVVNGAATYGNVIRSLHSKSGKPRQIMTIHMDRERIDTLQNIGIALKAPQTLEAPPKDSVANIVAEISKTIKKDEESWQRKRQSVLEGKGFSP